MMRAMVEWECATPAAGCRRRSWQARQRELTGNTVQAVFARILRPAASRSLRLSPSHHFFTSLADLPEVAAKRLIDFGSLPIHVLVLCLTA